MFKPRSSRPLTVVAILLAMFMSAMEATVVATVMPTVVADLSGLELYGWVGAIYMLAVTVTIPAWGKLSDVYGRRPILLAGIGLFLLGSLGSGFSKSMQMLVVMRAVQGLGAGSMQPITITIVGDIFTVEERARIQGVFGAVWGFSAMVGPLVGGMIVSALSWRWVFYINLPFGILSAALLLAFYRESDRPVVARKRLDLAGAAVLSGAILSLLLGVGGELASVTLPLSMVLFVAFVWIERRAEDPIVPLSLLRRPVIRMGSVIGGLIGAVMMGTVMYTPLFIQAVVGGTPTAGGTSVAPMLLGWPIMSAVSGRLLPKFGYRPLVRVGLACVGIGGVALYLAVRSAPVEPTTVTVWAIRIAAFVMGAGMGLANTAVMISVQDSVEHGQRGVATASTMFARSIGGALIVGALGAMLSALLRGKIPGHLLDDLLSPDRSKTDPEVLRAYHGVLFDGMAPLFIAVAALGLVTAVAALGFPAVPFRKRDASSPGEEPAGADLNAHAG